MSLLPFFAWCESSALGGTIRSSSWLFPVIEAVHLLGLAVIGGAILVVDLRLFGFGLRRQPVAHPHVYGDDRHGVVAVHVGGHKVLLPPGVLDEDDVPVPGDRLYFHGATQSGDGR